MLRSSALVLVSLALLACETPLALEPTTNPGVGLARQGDPPPPPEDADVIGLFGTPILFATSDLALTDEPPAVPGLLEFSLDGRYFVGGGGVNGWLRLSTSTDNVLTLSDPRITFHGGGGATGDGVIKVVFEHGYLYIDLATDISGATYSRTCAAGGAPCAVIDIAGADFLDLNGLFTTVSGTLVVLAEE